MSIFTESTIEQAAIDWLKDLDYTYAFSPEIAFYDAVCALARLRDGLPMPRVMRGEICVKDVKGEL